MKSVLFAIAITLTTICTSFAFAETPPQNAVNTDAVNTTTPESKSSFQQRREDRKHDTQTNTIIGSNVISNDDMSERLVKGLLYCVAIGFGLIMLNSYLRSKRENGGVNLIDLIEKRSIGNRTALLLVEVEGKKFFLSQTVDTVQILAPLSNPIDFNDAFGSAVKNQGTPKEVEIAPQLPRAVHE